MVILILIFAILGVFFALIEIITVLMFQLNVDHSASDTYDIVLLIVFRLL